MTQESSWRVTRRALLSRMLGAMALGLAGWRGLIRSAWAGPEGPGGRDTNSLIVRVARPLDAETPVREFASWLTPNGRFFIRSHFGPPPEEQIDPAAWRLRVNGLVERQLTLSLDELKQFPEVTVTAVLQCSGNGRAFFRPRVPGVQWERGAVGNARWTGIRLADVLARAGVQAAGRHVQLQGADRPVATTIPLFIRSIPIEKALHADTLLAYRMNGAPLPLLHGAPLRVIAPGWMADACLKWLTTITVSADEAKGYYMETAYRYPARPVEPGTTPNPRDMRPVEEMVVKSLIVEPAQGAIVGLGPVMIRGVAWTGEDRRIARVEVSMDDGTTWQPARLTGKDLPYAWRSWQVIWQPKGAGPAEILCRATDDRGATQPMASPWNPSGFLWNGVDRVRVEVRKA
ncbi:MAG: sulfite oxidase [Steroidobacteraceae bacterium]